MLTGFADGKSEYTKTINMEPGSERISPPIFHPVGSA